MKFISFLITMAILVLVLKILTFPFKLIKKVIVNSIIGGIVLTVLNFFGIIIVLKWWIIVLVALLGVPGVVISLIISLFI